MRYIKLIVILLVFCIVGAIVVTEMTKETSPNNVYKSERFFSLDRILGKKESGLDDLDGSESFGQLLYTMKKTSADVIDLLGNPDRKDPSAYGYEWWIYKENQSYVQIGIDNGIVETIFATGDEIVSEPFTIGTPYESLEAIYPFSQRVTYETGWKKYAFLLSDEDLQVKPLIQLTNDLYVVCYFDRFTNQLSSVRFMSADILLKQRLYDMEYRGTLETNRELSRVEWQLIEHGIERQILDITNMYRKRHNLATLQPDEAVSEVAFSHSKDMAERNYFSHDTPEGLSVGDRLHKRNIQYQIAGENIAFNLSDGPDVSEGWLNSEDHRKAVLEPAFTILGVGVYEKYYTQNFIFK